MMIFWLKERQSKEASAQRPAAAGWKEKKRRPSFFLTLLRDNFAPSHNHLQLHTHTHTHPDQQNVITITENVRANQWQLPVSRQWSSSLSHSATDQHAASLMKDVEPLSHNKRRAGFFLLFFSLASFCSFTAKKITPRIMTANWNAKIKKARMAPKWAIIDNVKDILRETSRPKVSQPVWVKAFWRREMITVRLTAVDDGWWAIFLRGKPRCWVTQSKNFIYIYFKGLKKTDETEVFSSAFARDKVQEITFWVADVT